MFQASEYRTNQTLLHFLREQLPRHKDLAAFKDLADTTLTFADFIEQAQQIARGLLAAGLQSGESVAILLPNGFHWELVQFGSFFARGVVVGLEAHATQERNNHIVRNSRCKFLFTDQTSLESVVGAPEFFSSVIFCGPRSQTPGDFVHLEDFLTQASQQALPTVYPEDVAICIYSSGTTGIPKGMAYTHGQIAGACRLMVQIFPEVGEGAKLICWLPLANLFQRMMNYCGLLVGACSYFEPDPKKIAESLPQVKPHLVIGVPRFYEKIYEGIFQKINSSPRWLRGVLSFCIWIGLQKHRGAWKPVTSVFAPFAEIILLKRVRMVFGGSLKGALTGSAPLRAEIQNFFAACGIEIFEAYGLSENILPVSINSRSGSRIGSVGKPLISENTKLSADGEILVRGPGIHSLVVDGKTVPAVRNHDEWHATGDLGFFDSEGFLTINGRRSEFIKTSTGRKIAHIPIEAKLARIKFVEHAFLIGDQEKYLMAFLSIDKTKLTSLEAKEEMRISILHHLKELNKELGDNSQVAGALVLAQPLSIQTGELTSNLKIRKKVILEKYKLLLKNLHDQIDQHPNEPTVLVTEGVQERVRRLGRIPPLARLTTNMFARLTIIAGLFVRCGARGALRSFAKDKHPYETAIIRDILLTVGPLKGPLLKVGQILSYMIDVLPEQIRKGIAPITSESAPMEPKIARQILEREFGDKLENIFSEFGEAPFATASITQLHWARLKTGEEVAIKLKYPGIEKAISADLLLLWLIVPILRLTTGIRNLQQLHGELSQLFLRECDLTEEARFQKKFAEIFGNDPKFLVPKVYKHLSNRNVLTMEYVRGAQFYQFVQNATPEARHNAAIAIQELTQRSIFVYGIFNADPHPGNFLFTDKQVVVLDFGFFKEWDQGFLRPWKKMIRAAFTDNFEEFLENAHSLKLFPDQNHPGYKRLHELYKMDPHLPKKAGAPTPDPLESKRMTTELISFFFQAKNITIPAGFIAVSRIFWGQLLLINQMDPPDQVFQQPRDVQENLLGKELADALFGKR